MEKERNNDKVSTFLTGFLLGGIVGVILGLLFAPQPGRDIREGWRGKLKELVSEGREVLREAVEEGKEAAAREQTTFRDSFSSRQ